MLDEIVVGLGAFVLISLRRGHSIFKITLSSSLDSIFSKDFIVLPEFPLTKLINSTVKIDNYERSFFKSISIIFRRPPKKM